MQLLDQLQVFSIYGTGPVALAALILMRLSALSFFLPGLGEQTVPVRVRLAVVVGLTLVLTPALIADFDAPSSLSVFTAYLIAEALTGALLGFAFRIALYAIQTAGAIASQSLSLAQLFGAGFTAQPESSIASLLYMSAMVVAVLSGLHFQAVAALIYSYSFFPIGVFPGAGPTGEWAVDRAAFSFSAGLSLALPFVVLGFVYNLAIGAANRAMPQLMVAFVGVPAITLAGLILFALSITTLLDKWLMLIDLSVSTLLGGAP